MIVKYKKENTEYMKYNIFIVRSPLQMLNAIEAKKHFNTKDNILVLCYGKRENNSSQVDALINNDEWDKIVTYEHGVRKFDKIMAQVSLVKNLRKYECDYIFSGELGTLNLLVIANTKHKNLYLIDDGIDTLHLYKISNPNISRDYTLKRKLKILRYALFGLKVKMQKLINFFTIYDLEPFLDQKIVSNNFNALKKRYLKDLKQDDKLYFLGQHLVQRKLMDNSTYVNYIKKVIQYYDATIVYIPHRTETISEELKLLFNDKFILQPSTGPVETRFLLAHIYPKHIVSFYSSALHTLDKIFDKTQIDSIYINPDDLLKQDNAINESYEFLEKTDVRRVVLN